MFGALERYRQAVDPRRVAKMLVGRSEFSRLGPLSAWVVIWLMIFQRLDARGTLSAAVRELLCGPTRRWVRRRSGKTSPELSASTSAYSQARSRLPLEVAEKVSDMIFESLLVKPTVLPGLQQPLFLLDGSTLLLAHSEDLARAYPPPRNQHGASHWPVVRVLVAHEVVSGLAVRPCWGPMDGPQAVSEQGLAKEMVRRLPAGSVGLGDRNFGVFSVAYHFHQAQHPCLLRLTAARARKVNGGALPNAGTDKKIRWECSCRWRRRRVPFWRARRGQGCGYALALGKHSNWRRKWRCLLSSRIVRAFGFGGAIGFAFDLENDRSFDQAIEKGHRQRAVRQIFSPFVEVHVGHQRGGALLAA